MKRENLTMFDLEAAFKALDEIEMPVAQKGIRANKVNLQETFRVTGASKTDLLLEDYYDIADTEDLEQAKADREAEVAKAKLARIEKIVDLAAESEEDLLPSYVGKVIIQCPQCMTLFYKEEADIVKSETDEETVNVAEVCQHCGNESGYTLIGKVEGVNEEELIPEENVEEIPAEEENLDLEPVEEVEETSEEGEEDLDLAPVEEAEDENSGEEEKVEESLKESKVVEIETDQLCSVVLDNRQMFVGSEKECEDYIKENNSDPAVSAHGGFKLLKTAKVPVSKEIEESLAESKTTRQRLTVIEPGYQYKDKDGSIYTLYDDECEEDNTGLTYDWEFVDDENGDIYIMIVESLTEAVDKDLQAKLDAHNEYIKFLQEEIEKEEKALEAAKNDFIKEAIQRRLAALKEDLEKALPEEVKNDTVEETPTEEIIEDEIQEEPTEEAPVVEEEPIEEKEETKESLKESRELDPITYMREKAAKKGWFEVPVEWFENEEFNSHMTPSILLKAIMSDPDQNIYFFDSNYKEDIIEIAKRSKIEVKESLIESLTEDTANKDLTDAEFKELMANLSKNESVEEDFDLDLLEEIDEKVLAKTAFKNLKENTKNLTAIKITNCEIKDSKLVLEGKIKVANEVKPLKYVCENFKIVDNENIKADCLAECLDSTKQCVINGNIKNNTLNITKIKNN